MVISNPVLIFAWLCLQAGVHSAITGRVTPSNSMVQASDVTYTFQLAFTQHLPLDGRLSIRFPSAYQDLPFKPLCQVGSIAVECNYIQTVRLLEFSAQSLLADVPQIDIRVKGVTNPSVVQTTGVFRVASYTSDDVLQEAGGTSFKITTTPGQISLYDLELANPTVGLFSQMTLTMRAEHPVPKDGQIRLTFPKWNQHDPTTANLEPMIAVGAQNSEINCETQSLISSCTFTLSQQSDELIVQLQESEQIKDTITLKLQGVRAPPSLSPVSGFQLQTTDSQGNPIDRVQDSSQITLTAQYPLKTSVSSVYVSAYPTTVSAKTKLTILVRNFNPLREGSIIKLYIPAEFGFVDGLISVTTSGAGLNVSPVFDVDFKTRVVTIEGFNSDYIQQYQASYFYISGVRNPANTERTASFKVELYDKHMAAIEFIDQGIYFQATTGGFVFVSFTQSDPYVFTQNVNYTFTIQPENSFTQDGILQITFPETFFISDAATVISESFAAQVQVMNNQDVVIRNAFPRGYEQGSVIEFTLTGVRNPKTTKQTQPIYLEVYYQNIQGGVELIDLYKGSELVMTPKPSPLISVEAKPSARGTGETNENFVIVGSTENEIESGSVLQVYIPSDFLIADPERAASSCTAISGFTDQITCEFVHLNDGSRLEIRGGFDSQSFPGGQFVFSLTDIVNPFTTQETKPFGLQVFDNDGLPLYAAERLNFTFTAEPSDFAFSFVKSASPKNGVSSIYTVSITLSVDTPQKATLQVVIPSELTFDPLRAQFCRGTLELKPDLKCNFVDEHQVNVILETQIATVIKNGTTVNFEIGYIANAWSLKETESFQLSTYSPDNNLINQRVTNLTILNTQRGGITINDISLPLTSALGQPSQILIQFTTDSLIPAGSTLSIIMPNNVNLSLAAKMVINGIQVPITVETTTLTIKAENLDGGTKEFTILVKDGLTNPKEAPYSYEGFSFEFSTSDGFTIDGVYVDNTWIYVECDGYCSHCVGTLDNCLSCGAGLLTSTVSYLYESECLVECPQGFFGDSGYQCTPCESPCTHCEFAADLCTQCDPSLGKPYANLATLTCVESCPAGTYTDEETMQCFPCKYPCYTCQSQTECLTCDHGSAGDLTYYFKNQCYAECPDVSVPSPSKVCVDCESPCQTCVDSPDKCTSCVAGLYEYKNLCVDKCPFNFYADDETMSCRGVDSFIVPFPFTIMAAMCTLFMTISHFMNHGKPDQSGGTAFFISCLACVDILLRVNWFVLCILNLDQRYWLFACWQAILLFLSTVLNIVIWRRFFKFKYNIDDNDYKFVAYQTKYPRTSRVIIYLSYAFSFQAIRLSYSRILGKKRFNAQFTRQRRYFRLIGRLSMMEILLLFIPAIGLNLYSLSVYEPFQQIYYLAIDSLILVLYATVLIAVTLTQRERVLDPKNLFRWGELLKWQVSSDSEQMYTQDELVQAAQKAEDEFNRRKRRKVMTEISDEDSSEVNKRKYPDGAYMSAKEHMEIVKGSLYKNEHLGKEAAQSSSGIMYNDVLQRLDRMILLKKLYENLRNDNGTRQSELKKSLLQAHKEKDDLQQTIRRLERELRQSKNKRRSSQQPKVELLRHEISSNSSKSLPPAGAAKKRLKPGIKKKP